MVHKQIMYKGNLYRNTEELSSVIKLPIQQLDELVNFCNENVLTDNDIAEYVEYVKKVKSTENKVKDIEITEREDYKKIPSVKPIDFDAIVKDKREPLINTVQVGNPECDRRLALKIKHDEHIYEEKIKKAKQAEKEKQKRIKLAIKQLEKIAPRDKDNRIVCSYDTFPTIEALCKTYNILPTTLLDRVKVRGSLEDVIRDLRHAPKIFCCGKWYHSKDQILRENHITKNDLQTRMSKGLTLDQAVSLGPSKTYEVTYGGVTYKSKSELCKQFGISYNMVTSLIHRGVPLEKAVDIAYEKKEMGTDSRKEPIMCLGVQYNSIKELMNTLGINKATLRRRLKAGTKLEQAVIEILEMKQRRKGGTHE